VCVCVLLLLAGAWVGAMIIIPDENVMYYADHHNHSINKFSLTTRKITFLIDAASYGLAMDRDAG